MQFLYDIALIFKPPITTAADDNFDFIIIIIIIIVVVLLKKTILDIPYDSQADDSYEISRFIFSEKKNKIKKKKIKSPKRFALHFKGIYELYVNLVG